MVFAIYFLKFWCSLRVKSTKRHSKITLNSELEFAASKREKNVILVLPWHSSVVVSDLKCKFPSTCVKEGLQMLNLLYLVANTYFIYSQSWNSKSILRN